MTQYGFLIDLSRCTGCNACVIACKQWHHIEPGPAKFMRVYQWEKGTFPEIDLRVLPIMCFHCETPLCADACPNGAIKKEDKYGAVLVDPQKCTGQRKCWEACPYGTPQFKSDDPAEKMLKCNMCIDRLEEGLAPICVLSCSLRALEFGPIDELMEKYGDTGAEKRPMKDYAPCRLACPAQVDAQGYIELASQGNFKEALALFRETTPFAGVLGRACAHPCEVDCLRGRFDDAVSICAVKRFIADRELETGREKATPAPKSRTEKVAVIGSGPAGLTCAFDLARLGYPVTVFEAAPFPGGLMRYGIPEYRMPARVLENEIAFIEETGVDIRPNTPVTRIEDLFEQGYGAVFTATGAWKSQRLNVPGEDARGILHAVDFLRGVKSGEKQDPGRKVVVIGGGSVAVDAARTALRLGAGDVRIVCLECLDFQSKDRMLATAGEIEEAREEGVTIHPCLGVKTLLVREGHVTGVETLACTSVRDDDGSFNPRLSECEFPLTLEADRVIVAIGQAVDASTLPSGVALSDRGTVSVNPLTLQTADERVFAGGDATTGPVDIISAISAGKEGAVSIDRYLRGRDLEKDRRMPAKSIRERVEKKSLRSPLLEAKERKGFREVDLGYSRPTALEQAGRCLKCGTLVPSVVIKREASKKQIIPWDAIRALELWRKRHPDTGEALPDVFTDMNDVLRRPEPGMIGRNKLVLKAKNSEEILFYTTDDE